MRHNKVMWLLVVVLLVLAVATAAADTPSAPVSDNGVIPYIFGGAPQGGNVDCDQIGYDFSSGRIDYVAGAFEGEFPDGISVAVTDGTYVEWGSTFPIGAVIVKGGDDANIYEYIPPSFGDSGLASPINASGQPASLSNLTFCWNKALDVSKTVVTTFDRAWMWSIEKEGDQSELTLSVGQIFTVNYDVVVDASPEDSNWAVSGEITIYNPNPSAVATIESVSDVISLGIAASEDCGVEFPYHLSGGATLTCDYSTVLPDGSSRENTATVTTSGKVAGGSATEPVTFGAPTNETDECVDVTDDQYGILGTVCAGDVPRTFQYSLDIGPYEACGMYEFVNTASFVTNDTATTDSSSWMVTINVPCATGCTLTQGYWKTHSEFGPAPYDDTWAMLANGASTIFFLSGQTYYEVLWTAPAGNVYYNLAHQYIAAELNFLNGADPSAAQAAFDAATALFETYTPAEVDGLKGNAKKQWTDLATILDNYNNGLIGPGHCSE